MEEIYKYIVNYITTTFYVNEQDIKNNCMSEYMESLDMLELICELENTYKIIIDEDWEKWKNANLKKFAEYIDKKVKEKN